MARQSHDNFYSQCLGRFPLSGSILDTVAENLTQLVFKNFTIIFFIMIFGLTVDLAYNSTGWAKNENWLAVDKVIAKIIRLTFLAHPVGAVCIVHRLLHTVYGPRPIIGLYR